MPKAKWGTPAYTGRPSSYKVTNRFMMVLFIILAAGFIKVGLREGWFESIINFILY